MTGLSFDWQIFYDNGAVYQGRLELAPTLGVICILEGKPVARIVERSDYYVWKFKESGWTGVDIFGLWDYLSQPGFKKVLFGRTVSNETFESIHNKAYSEMTNG